MVDLGPLQDTLVDGVLAVALRQEVRKRAGIGVDPLADRAVAPTERGRLAASIAPPALVREPPVPHGRAVVGQLVGPPGPLNRELARRIEAEEPDTRLSARGDVGPGIELQ